ncbi:(2,3-dihydroxybenzoyl)adenylate synthase [Nocardia sp. NPDC055321]
MLDGFVPWPDDFARRYRTAGYWIGESLGDSLRRYGDTFGDRIALVDPGGAGRGGIEWSYAELDAEADRYAAGLYASGIRSRDRVVVQLPNHAEFVALIYGIVRIGAIPVFALPAHRYADIAYFVEHTGAVAYVVVDEYDGFDYRDLARRVAAESTTLRHIVIHGAAAEFTALADLRADPIELAPVDPADVAVLLMSGGTTGLPKLVARTHDDWSYSGRAVAASCDYDDTTRHLICLPIPHNWTLTHGMLATFHAGGRLVLAPSPDPSVAFEIIERQRITDTGLVPGAALAWVESAPYYDFDLSSLRRIVIGGTKLPTELARRVEPALGGKVHQAFGMAEGLCGFQSGADDLELRLTAQGRPVSPADELRIVGPDGDVVPDGEVGELLTRGPYTIRGYYRGGAHNERSFTPDGFYRTGDLVRVLPNGQVVFEGRVKDQINRGGEKIAAEEVENHILAHEQVLDVAVVGLPDSLLGERSCAFVRVRDGARVDQSALAGFLTDRGVAPFKIPDLVRTVDELPRTAVGKIDKKRLATFS